MAKAAHWPGTDAEVRKRGEQTGLDTLVVHAVKGIDGGPHKRWSMWFNSTQREEPYQPLTCPDGFQRWIPPSNGPGHRCCMAVVSSCREMLG